MEHIVKIKSIEHLTPDVLQIVTEKPEHYSFKPGQATDVSIHKAGWENELRAFTFTSLPVDNQIEFTIKTYPSRNGLTNQLLQLQKGDELILHDVFGDIAYKGEGLFIAGGAGITPFLAIIRQLNLKNELGNNKLIFANKTKADIIHKQAFDRLLGDHFINVLSDEQADGYAHGHITAEMLKEHIMLNKPVYLCGPPPMMEAVEKILSEFKIDEKLIVKEGF